MSKVNAYEMRCLKCGRKLGMVGTDLTTAIEIKCSRCHAINKIDGTPGGLNIELVPPHIGPTEHKGKRDNQ